MEITYDELYQKYIVQKMSRKDIADYYGLKEDQLKYILSQYKILKKPRGVVHPVTWSVYKHTNKINGKCYIGITNQRFVVHRWGRKGQRYNQLGQKKFWSAIVKYGWNNFDHEIIESGIQTPEEANEREKYWIAFYDSFKHGYNATIGGCGGTGHKLTTEERERMGRANIGSKHHTQKHSEETKKLISEIHKGKRLSPRTEFKKGHVPWSKGKPMPPHVKEALRKANIGKVPYNKGKFGFECPYSKTVLQYDTEGNFIREWGSTWEVQRELGFDRSSIARCCRGEYKQLRGYVWKYKK